MAKEDVGDAPWVVPTKRRQLESVPDLWLAQWLGRGLSPSQRKRVEEERYNRRRRANVQDVRVGVIIGPEGVTPDQLVGLRRALLRLQPTEIHHGRLPSKVHQLCREYAPVVVHKELMARHQNIIKASDVVVVCPRSQAGPTWENVKYARHRSLPVHVVMPNGKEQ